MNWIIGLICNIVLAYFVAEYYTCFTGWDSKGWYVAFIILSIPFGTPLAVIAIVIYLMQLIFEWGGSDPCPLIPFL